MKCVRTLLSVIAVCLSVVLGAESIKLLEPVQGHVKSVEGMVVVNAYQQRIHSSKFELPLNSSIGIVVQSDGLASYIVTHASLVSGAGRLSVDVTGEGGVREAMPAQILALRPKLDYALLKVEQLQVPTIAFAITAPKAGSSIWAAHLLNLPGQKATTSAVSFTRGLFENSVLVTPQGMEIVNHSAGLNFDVDSMLFNDCGELIGFNLSSDKEWQSQRAISAASVANLVATENLSIRLAEFRCQSDVERARIGLNHAHTEADATKREAELAIARADEISLAPTSSNSTKSSLVLALKQAELEAARATEIARRAGLGAEKNRQIFERASARLQRDTEVKLEKIKADHLLVEQKFDEVLAEQQAVVDTQALWFWLLLASLLSVLTTLFISRMRRGPARNKLSEFGSASADSSDTQKVKRAEEDDMKTVLATSGVTEYVLDGKDELGLRYLLRIQEGQLMSEQGVVLGRNPGSVYAISHGDVSRKHCCLNLVERRLFIEDLGSTNGTRVNGRDLKDKGRVMLNDGDQIALGSVVMELAIIKI